MFICWNIKFFKAAKASFYKTVYGIYIKNIFLRVSLQLAEDARLESECATDHIFSFTSLCSVRTET